MKRIALIIVAVMGTLPIAAQIVNDSDRETLEKIKTGNREYTSIDSGFKQTKHISILGEDIESKGTFHYDKPDKLILEYTVPEGDLMSFEGEKMAMVASGKRSEANSKSNAKMRGMKNILASCIQGDLMEVNAQSIACETNGKHYIVTIEIDKKTNKSGIGKVVASYDKSNLTISILQTFEQDGSYTIYELSDKKIKK